MKMDRRTFAVTLLAGVVTSLLAQPSEAQVGSRARNVVLVHGAYADGSSWSEVIPLLQRSEERRVGNECRSRWSPYH